MEQTPLFTQSEIDDTPFPLLIAKRFNFPLAYHESGDEAYHAIQDWLRGLMGKQNISTNLAYLKHHRLWQEISNRIRPMPYRATDGKTYQREFTTAENLILILNYLRPMKSSHSVSEAKEFWVSWFTAKSETRQKMRSHISSTTPEEIFEEEGEASSPTHMIGIANQNALKSGVNMETIDTMFNRKLQIPHLLDELIERVVDPILPKYYDIITEEIYRGLWKRSPKRLKLELGLVSVTSLSEHMPSLGRSFHRIVRESVLWVLSQQESLWWADIRFTVRKYARFFGQMAKEMSKNVGKDLATGLPLLRP